MDALSTIKTGMYRARLSIGAFIAVVTLGSFIEPSQAAAGLQEWMATAPPAGAARIIRDHWGVPHIQARREDDGFYALGYAIAQDNLEDQLRQLVIGRGQMARYFGADYVELDHLYALFDVRREAEKGYGRLPPQLKRDVDAYIEGFDRYLTDHPDERPEWARDFEPNGVDVIGFDQVFTLLFPVNLADGIADCRRGGVNIPSTDGLFFNLLKTGGPMNASTGWAASPWRTRDNVAIHLADPHSALSIPSPEFRMHAGDIEIAGYMSALLMVGHTRHLAWGTTFGAPDVADCYEIATQPDSPTVYLKDGAKKSVEQQKIEVEVKGAPAREFTLEYVELNGFRAPVVARQDGKLYAVVTPYLTGAEGSLVDLYKVIHSKNLGEMRKALSDQGLFPVGLTVADSSGNIGYFRIGRAPVRDDALDWRRPVSGNDSRADWHGLHPFQDLVQIMNPKQGYVRETNLAPESMWGGDNPFHPPAYPRYILNDNLELNSSTSPVARGRRVDDVLSRTFSLSPERAQSYVFNETWPFVTLWQNALLKALGAPDAGADKLGPDEKKIAQRALQFDGVAAKTSKDALAYQYWEEGVAGVLADAKVDKMQFAHRIASGAAVSTDFPVLIRALSRAAATMTQLKQWDAVYGDVFRIGRAGASFPIGGCGTPFEASLHTFDCPAPGQPQRFAVAGQKQIMLTVFTNPIQSYSLAAFGQDWRQVPKGPHVDDQAEMSSNHELKPVLFEYSELQSHIESSLTLKRATQ